MVLSGALGPLSRLRPARLQAVRNGCLPRADHPWLSGGDLLLVFPRRALPAEGE